MSGFDAASNLAFKAFRRLQAAHKPIVRRLRRVERAREHAAFRQEVAEVEREIAAIAAGRGGETPRAVVGCGDAAAILRRSAISHLAPGAGDGLEPARREKGDGTPVGAPGRRVPAFGAGDRLGPLGIQGPAPQLRAASGCRDEDHLVTGGREGGLEAVVTNAELGAWWRSQ
jgi:hypothetical protein